MRRAALLLLPLVLAAVTSRADEVRLRNGKVFEGVLAEEQGDTVLVRIPGGTLSLSRASVREIVRSPSPFAEYLLRSRALRANGGSAAQWLELARWARAHEMATAAREAALAAAEIDSRLDGLAPLLRGFGYEFDESDGRWLPLAEVMKRRGLVLAEGRWMTRGEALERSRLEAEEARERRQAREAARIERVTAEARLAAAEIELAQARYGPQQPAAVYVMPSAYVWPVAVFPGFPMPPVVPVPMPPRRHDSPPRPFEPRLHHGTMTLDMVTRQPGSLFPGELDLSGRSSDTSRR